MLSLGLQWLCNLENRARPRMNTGVPRIVTTGEPVVTMRVGADHWRRNAETVGSGGRQGFVREHAAEDTRTRLSDSTRLAQVDIVRQLSPLGTAKSAELQTVNKRHPR